MNARSAAVIGLFALAVAAGAAGFGIYRRLSGAGASPATSAEDAENLLLILLAMGAACACLGIMVWRAMNVAGAERQAGDGEDAGDDRTEGITVREENGEDPCAD
jgi:hypothetical protein